jgi:hypothetical protein
MAGEGEIADFVGRKNVHACSFSGRIPKNRPWIWIRDEKGKDQYTRKQPSATSMIEWPK